MKFTPSALVAVFAAVVVNGQDPTWKPGDFSDGTILEDTKRGTKLFLSNGLMGKAVAYGGEPVMAADGTQLADAYHANCDGGAAIDKGDGSGGYYYVSNSEIGDYPSDLSGGVYSLEFNADHELVGYQRVLGNTAKNCHGGETPWSTWVSCEEHREFGRCWQVDPSGLIEAKATNLTGIYVRCFSPVLTAQREDNYFTSPISTIVFLYPSSTINHLSSLAANARFRKLGGFCLGFAVEPATRVRDE